MSNASLSLEEIDQLGELLASVPEPYVPMEADMLDGFLTAIALMQRPPKIDEWMVYVLDEQGRSIPVLTNGAKLRALILKRGAQLEADILSETPIDPVLYDAEGDEAPISALTPFADGFSAACDLWPELLQSKSKAVQAALVGILRYSSPDDDKSDADEEEEEKIIKGISEDVAFVNLDEALADLQSCVQEIAEVTRERDLKKKPAHPARRR